VKYNKYCGNRKLRRTCRSSSRAATY